MPVNTITVGAAVTPTVIETYISHYLNRRPLHQKPTAHISYHEGLELIRRFLNYASFNTVEELQAFTSQWVPVPVWVHVDVVDIPKAQLARSAELLSAQLGPEGVKAVGGPTWWQWRRDDKPLKAEWIEMRKDMEERKKWRDSRGQRIMLYVHGGAYFFGSVDEHRYQMQRHARKLRARVLAPRYRLAPQFPFPCGLMDCLAAYLYLLETKHDPSTIILAGDSAGGGMVLSMLVTLRDQGIPLPAGAVLISPWVDLTHSFPSLSGDGKMDYIPAHGFVHKPSMSWPPPNADDLLAYEGSPRASQQKEKRPSKEDKDAKKEEKADRVRGFSVTSPEQPGTETLLKPPEAAEAPANVYVAENGKYSIGPGLILSVQLDGSHVEIKDQIQMYAPNHMLTHPLVSPVLQPSLGGLPPLLIQVGGGELLRDEQLYLAHKAAQPLAYPPPPSNHQTAATIQEQAARHRPTNVQLQLWEDLCHVAPTLSFTRPAKYMYRSIAQFGAWALARAQKTSIDILDDDSISFVSTDSSNNSANESSDSNLSPDEIKLSMPSSAQHVGFESVRSKEDKRPQVGKAGDPLPPFEHHMIRQRVDRHGRVHPLAPAEELEALNLPTADIGVPKSGPVNKWMKAQKQWNGKFAKQKLKVQKKRMRDIERGYEGFNGETPPPTALAGRRVKGMKAEKAQKRSWGMSMWSGWGSKHDKMTIGREEKADQSPDQDPSETVQQPDEPSADGTLDAKPKGAKPPSKPRRKTFTRSHGSNLAPASTTGQPRSRSRHSAVTDKGQITDSMANLAQLAPPPTAGLAEATVIAPERKASPLPTPASEMSHAGFPAPASAAPDIVISRPQSPETLIPATDTLSTRPTRGGVAYPFRLKIDGRDGKEVNASTVTLQSVNVGTPMTGEFPTQDKVLPQTSTEEAAGVDTEDEKAERPGMERFVTAGLGELDGAQPEDEKLERPGVERFETAQEGLDVVGNKKD